MKKIKFMLLRAGIFALIFIIGYSSYQLWKIQRNNQQEAEMRHRLMQYDPAIGQETLYVGSAPKNTPSESKTNQSIIDLQAVYPDVAGWLTIPNTMVSYPFVKSVNNDDYLHMDLDGKWSASGTLFMDFQNSHDFSDFNTIIFGHNMKNGSMFGTLQSFDNKAFFEENRIGLIFLADKSYEIEFISFSVIESDIEEIYNPTTKTTEDKLAFLNYAKNSAHHYRDIEASVNDRFVTLSTCSYAFDDARMVLVGRVVEVL